MQAPTTFETLAATARRHPSSAASRGALITTQQVIGGKVYHGSRVELAVGDRVRPGWGTNHDRSPDGAICVTSSLDLALYWAQLGGYGRVFVYEVEPTELIEVWRCSLDAQRRLVRLMEGRVTSARVVSVVAAEAPWQRQHDDPPEPRRSWWARLLRWVRR